jgi:excisionase family DNA binding protein
MTTELRDYLSVSDTAVLLGFSEKKVRGLLKNGTIPSCQIGRQYVIPRAKLEAVIDSMVDRGGPRR